MRFVLVAIPIVLLVGPVLVAGDDERPATGTFAAERFYRDVRALVRRHYPDATAHRLGDRIHFEHDTRIFVVHDALKTGRWQDPREERGPRTHGVMGDLSFQRGAYLGALEVPQTIDKLYFKVLLRAPHAEGLGGHLYVRLKLPGLGEPREGFVQQLDALISRFGEYAEEE